MTPSPAFRLPLPDISRWRAGNTGVQGVWHFDSGRPGIHAMVTALVHGNELCGAWAIRGLLEAGIRPAEGRLTLAFCNLKAFDRFDPANHDASRFVAEDFNRVWGDASRREGDTPERRRARELAPFVEQADWLLDLHSMHEPGEPLMLTGLQPRNVDLAWRLAAPARIVMDKGHRDGTRMRDHGRFGLPDDQAPASRSLLVECGFHGDEASRTVARDVCIRFLEQCGTMAAGQAARQLAGWRQADGRPRGALRVVGAVVAQSDRFRFSQRWKNLERVERAGTPIGEEDGRVECTPFDDCVLVMPSLRQARAGVTVVRLAREEPIPAR